jgi:hypothetical protein
MGGVVEDEFFTGRRTMGLGRYKFTGKRKQEHSTLARRKTCKMIC